MRYQVRIEGREPPIIVAEFAQVRHAVAWTPIYQREMCDSGRPLKVEVWDTMGACLIGRDHGEESETDRIMGELGEGIKPEDMASEGEAMGVFAIKPQEWRGMGEQGKRIVRALAKPVGVESRGVADCVERYSELRGGLGDIGRDGARDCLESLRECLQLAEIDSDGGVLALEALESIRPILRRMIVSKGQK